MNDSDQASIEDVQRIAGQLADEWALCNFLDKCEAEVIIFRTIRASVNNADTYGQPFSFQGGGLRSSSGCGLVENGVGLKLTLDRGLLIEGEYEGRPTLIPTVRLIKQLDGHLSKATV